MIYPYISRTGQVFEQTSLDLGILGNNKKQTKNKGMRYEDVYLLREKKGNLSEVKLVISEWQRGK